MIQCSILTCQTIFDETRYIKTLQDTYEVAVCPMCAVSYFDIKSKRAYKVKCAECAEVTDQDQWIKYITKDPRMIYIECMTCPECTNTINKREFEKCLVL